MTIGFIICPISFYLAHHSNCSAGYSSFCPGIYLSGSLAALIAAVLLGFVNAIVRPILIILTPPITILTLGLFLLIINTISLLIVAALTPG
ncbi:MAG TPA: phage holin family protein, partial [Candidatus Caenarcaniphilales bacterium]